MVPWQQRRAKAVYEALKKTKVKLVEERGATDAEVLVRAEVNWSDRPATLVGPVDEGSAQDRSDRPATPVRPVNEVLVQIAAEVPAFSQSCSEVPTPAEDEEEMLDYEP
jgi:outer membrane lipopolysaccharide assembly protein LptE/RlpB